VYDWTVSESDGGFQARDRHDLAPSRTFAPVVPTDEGHGTTRTTQTPPFDADPDMDHAPTRPADPRALLDWVDDPGHGTASPPVLGFHHESAGSIQLNPNAPQRMPVPGPPPLAKEADLEARASRMEAERLLTSKKLESGDNATKAMELLIDVPEQQRGKVIDDLDDKAFENLLDRVPHDQRERFAKLVDGSKKPARKLRLWGEFHKSRARNDLRRLKGDTGAEDPYTQRDIDDLTKEPGQPEREEEEIDHEEPGSRTDPQDRNLDKHRRRTASVVGTHGEIDRETDRLLEKAKKGELTLAEVDAVRERKDLEYEIERDNNIQLTANEVRADKEPVMWSAPELELVRTTLARLPDAHVRGASTFKELHRKMSQNIFTDGTGGLHQGDTIDITDWGASTGKGFKHGGDPREMVSDAFRRDHGDTVGTLEYVLTHEIGHDVADHDPKAFEKFQKAAGWTEMTTGALKSDHVTPTDLAALEAARANPNQAQLDIGGTQKTYSPIKDKETFWGVDRTAIPAAPTADPSDPEARPNDTWQYARVNPQEHFAEVYAKAVHVPKQLHHDLVAQPAEDAQRARDAVEAQQRAIAHLESSSSDGLKLVEMRARLATLEQEKTLAIRAERQRGEEFSVMRNDVFHTDKAVAAVKSRLQAQAVSADKIREFEKQAAIASTPEQVEVLASQVTR
jgi:hypothetical protein